jgi:hypothetical protein
VAIGHVKQGIDPSAKALTVYRLRSGAAIR